MPTEKTRLAFDTETALIRPGLLAPPLTCVTAAGAWMPEGDLLWQGNPSTVNIVKGWLKDKSLLLIGHTVAYDLAVLGSEYPELLPLIFEALESDRVTDTSLRQKLIDIARGQYRGFTDAFTQKRTEHTYHLAVLAKRLLGVLLEKDEFRLGYGELRDVPPEKWAEGARRYALNDAITTLDVHEAQEVDRELLADEFRQTRAAFGMHLISCHGIRTDAEKIRAFELETRAAFGKALTMCKEAGLVRKDGSRDTKKARALMVEVMADLDEKPKRTKGFFKLHAKKRNNEELTKRNIKDLDDPLFGISLDEEACNASGNDLLKAYASVSSLMTVVNDHIPALKNGITHAIQPHFDSLMETGRASCKGYSEDAPTDGYQMHNVRRLAGIRECFTARPGKLYANADFDGLELRSWSQVCIWALGESRMAEMLNKGVDVHLDLAAQFMGIEYNHARDLLEAGDPEMVAARQFAKIGNFGFMGGMQAKSFRAHARGSGIFRTLAECQALLDAWLTNWPEARKYSLWIRAQCDQGGGYATIKHFMSDRWRGLVPYTVASNSFFQGLGADATKAALFALQKASYVETESPLFGCRMVNYVHDEFMLEVPEELRAANRAADELVRVMNKAAGEWLPDVPPTSSVALMKHWAKKAKAVRNEEGLLIPWEMRQAA